MDTRKVHVEHLHAQISQDGYRIDPDAIAEAILRRLLDGHDRNRRNPLDDEA
jgi:hypothetical protein